jgi:hypothetical protein
MCLNLLHVEDNDLSGTLAAMRQTLSQAGQTSVQRLRDTLKAAVDTIGGVGKRRQQFGKALERIRSGKAPKAPPPAAAQEQARKRMEVVRGTVADALARAQAMSVQDFADNRERLVDAVLAAVFGPQTPPAQEAPKPSGEAPKPSVEAPQPSVEAPQPVFPATADARQRIQSKLLAAATPYLALSDQPDQKDLAATLASIFAAARSLLAAGEVAEAEKRADEGLLLLGLDPAGIGLPSGPGSRVGPPVPAPDQPALQTGP